MYVLNKKFSSFSINPNVLNINKVLLKAQYEKYNLGVNGVRNH